MEPLKTPRPSPIHPPQQTPPTPSPNKPPDSKEASLAKKALEPQQETQQTKEWGIVSWFSSLWGPKKEEDEKALLQKPPSKQEKELSREAEGESQGNLPQDIVEENEKVNLPKRDENLPASPGFKGSLHSANQSLLRDETQPLQTPQTPTLKEQARKVDDAINPIKEKEVNPVETPKKTSPPLPQRSPRVFDRPEDIFIVQRAEQPPKEKEIDIPDWIKSFAINRFDITEQQAAATVSQQKKIMSKFDPQFRNLFDLIHSPLLSLVADEKNKIPSSSIPAVKRLSSVILARLFTRLSTNVDSKKESINGYANRPSLANIISYVCLVTGEDTLNSFNKIEEKYKNIRSNYKLITKKLKIDPKNLPLIQKYINSNPSSGLDRKSIEKQIFSNEKNKNQPLIEEFLDTLDQLRERKMLINQKFKLMSEKLLKDLLPDGLASIPELKGFIVSLFGGKVLSSITNLLTGYLSDTYESMKPDPLLIEGWKQDLEVRTNSNLDFTSLLKAPTDLVFAYVKDGIQTDPRVIKMLTSRINQLKHPEVYSKLETASKEPPKPTKEQLLGEISNKNFATWLISSVQSVLVVDNDPNLNGIRLFIEQALNNLTLGFTAEGAKLALDKEDEIDKSQFLKVIVERGIKKMNAFSKGDQELSDQFFENFIRFFPLPETIKINYILPELIEQSKSLKNQLKEFTNIQKLHDAAESKVKAYMGGEEIVKVIDNISHILVETLLEKNSNLTSMFGVDETLDELFAQYLPHTHVDQNVKQWFRDNVAAFRYSKPGEDSSKATELLKKGLKTTLLTALVNTIETSQIIQGKDHIKQLLQKSQIIFTNAFKNLDESQRKKIDQAFEIKSKIDAKKKQIQDIKKKVSKKPTLQDGITKEQIALLDEEIQANIRRELALAKINQLHERKKEILKKLNLNKDKNKEWKEDQIARVSKAARIREKLLANEKTLPISDEVLQKEIDQMQEVAPHKISLKVLKKLLNSTPEDIENIFEISQIDEMLSLCKKEVKNLESEFSAIQNKVKQFDPNKFVDAQGNKKSVEPSNPNYDQNKEAWKKALAWKDTVLTSKEDIKKLTFGSPDDLNDLSIAELEKKLDAELDLFQNLAEELLGIFGIEKFNPDYKVEAQDEKTKKSLEIPSFFKEKAWPYIKDAKKQLLPRLLFEYTAPLLISYKDIDINKIKLEEAFKSPTMPALIHGFSNHAIDVLVPQFFASYQTFAQEILTDIGISSPSHEDILKMETSIKNTLIQIGKKNLTEKLLYPIIEKTFQNIQVDQVIPDNGIASICQNLIQIISKSPHQEVTKEEVLKALTLIKDPSTQEKIAKALSASINSYIFNLGKTKLTAENLLEAYNNQMSDTQPQIPDDMKAILEKINKKNLVKRIQAVVISPEEIAQTIDVLVPGSASFIIPHIHAILQSQDDALKDTRELFQKCFEGTALRLLLKIGEANEDPNDDPLTVFTKKMRELAVSTVPEDPDDPKSVNEAANQMVDKFLKEILQIGPSKGLESIPVALQEKVYEEIHKVVQQNIAPIQSVIIDTHQSKLTLNEKSGSKFLSSLCTALSEDLLTKRLVISKKQILDLLKALAPEADDQQMNALAENLLNSLNVANPFVEGLLLKIFNRIAEKNPTKKDKDTLFILTEKLLEIVSKKYKEAKLKNKEFDPLAQELNDAIMNDLLGINTPEVFVGLPEGVQKEIYDIIKSVIKDFTVKLKDSLFTLEKSPLKEDQTEPSTKKDNKELEKYAAESMNAYTSIIAKDIANVVLTATPHVLAENIEGGIKGVTLVSKTVENFLEDLSLGNLEVAKILLNYSKAGLFKQFLGSKLTELHDKETLKEDKEKIAALLANGILKPLNGVLDRANKALDKKEVKEQEILQDKSQTLMVELLKVFTQHFKNLNAAKDIAKGENRTDIQFQDFVKAAKADSSLHAGVPESALDYEETINEIEKRLDIQNLSDEQIVKWNQEKMSIRKVIKTIVRNENKGRKAINQEDFINAFNPVIKKVIGFNLNQIQIEKLWNPRITGSVTPEQIKELENSNIGRKSLKMIIRDEANTINQRRNEARKPFVESLMTMLFPNGKQDLTFIPEEMQDLAWNQFKDNLLPIGLQMFTEVMFDPNTINNMVLASLEALNENLSGPIVLEDEKPIPLKENEFRIGEEIYVMEEEEGSEEGFMRIEKKPEDPLDVVAGDLITEIMKSVKLPGWAKKIMVDPKTGQSTKDMKKILGAVMRKKFSHTFLKEMLGMTMEKLVSKDDKGQPFFSYTPMTMAESQTASEKKGKELKEKLEAVSRKSVDISISYYFRSKWALFHKGIEEALPKALVNAGSATKKFFQRSDWVNAFCRKLFIEFFGALFYIITLPITWPTRQFIYWIISLDTNRDELLKMITTIPKDQPEIESQYVVFHENLAFKLRDVLDASLRNFG